MSIVYRPGHNFRVGMALPYRGDEDFGAQHRGSYSPAEVWKVFSFWPSLPLIFRFFLLVNLATGLNKMCAVVCLEEL